MPTAAATIADGATVGAADAFDRVTGAAARDAAVGGTDRGPWAPAARALPPPRSRARAPPPPAWVSRRASAAAAAAVALPPPPPPPPPPSTAVVSRVAGMRDGAAAADRRGGGGGGDGGGGGGGGVRRGARVGSVARHGGDGRGDGGRLSLLTDDGMGFATAPGASSGSLRRRWPERRRRPPVAFGAWVRPLRGGGDPPLAAGGGRCASFAGGRGGL